LRTGAIHSLVSAKFFNVYGPNEYHKGDMRSVVHKAFEEIRAGSSMRLFASSHPDFPDGGQMRDFLYVKDCAEMLCFLAEKRDLNGIFNMGTGKARTWNDLANAVFDALGLPRRIAYIPMSAHLAGKYQNFTRAETARLLAAGCPAPAYDLEQGINDYVTRYLMRGQAFL
jgi:ADP-L-glycero-D-manno-heptose 6-epimerase